MSGTLGLRLGPDKDKKGEGLMMFFAKKKGSPEIQEGREIIERLLGLNPEKTEFSIFHGPMPGRDDVIVLHTRSGFQLLHDLAIFVEVYEEHEREQRAYPHLPAPPKGQEAPPLLIRILSDATKPTNAVAKVHYDDLWFWIDNRDLALKGLFSFLLVMLTLAETGEKALSPLVTFQATKGVPPAWSNVGIHSDERKETYQCEMRVSEPRGFVWSAIVKQGLDRGHADMEVGCVINDLEGR